MTELEKDILECAKINGYRADKGITKIHRGVTAPFAGSRDLGEWWVTNDKSFVIFTVKDNELKQFIRNKKIKDLGL